MNVHLVKICHNKREFPDLALPEIACAGRSNSGKSSLINALVGQKIARTSATPGRTRQVFFLEVCWAKDAQPIGLVDLPGYGYAKSGRKAQEEWNALVNDYLQNRDQLKGLLMLHDIRRSLGAEEKEILAWAQGHELHYCVVLTKADKLAKSKRTLAVSRMQKELGNKQAALACAVTDTQTIDRLRQRITTMAG